MGTVATSTAAAATAFSNQRREDRTSNGVLWTLTQTQPGVLRLEYSTDGGTSWLDGGQVVSGGTTYTASGSLKIDEDDFLTVAYKDPSDGYIKAVRGTPNAARTAYTLGTAFTVRNGTATGAPDIDVCRNPASPGTWVACVVYGWTNANPPHAHILDISSAGAISDRGPTSLGANMANGVDAFPSIDFNHTGDGKTVAGGTPHLYVGWSAGATGSGYGLRFRKATYSGGSWTWGTEREIDNTRFLPPTGGRWFNTVFDGTRVVMVGVLSDYQLVAHEVNAADTAITPRVLNSSSAVADLLTYGGATFDSSGNIYSFGADQTGANGTRKLNYRKWDRATQVLGPIVTFDATGPDAPYVSVRRGPQGQAIDYVYTDGTASPYTVTSGRIVLNQNPTAPTPLTPADNATWDSSTDQTVTFRHNDPDGDSTSSYAIWLRPAGTSTTYQAITGTATVANGGTATITIPANTVAGVLSYYSTTTDPSGAVSPPSPIRTVTAVPASLAAATGGSGGTAFTALTLYNATEVDRVQRVVTRAVLTTVTAVSPLTITIDGGPATALRNAGYTPTVGDQVQAEYTSGQWVVVDKVVS